jgi:uncharacterized protein YceK
MLFQISYGFEYYLLLDYYWSRWAAGESGCSAVLARTQALTGQSLQQVAEGLTRWTDAEMKHWSKDLPVFDGQVIHYIA